MFHIRSDVVMWLIVWAFIGSSLGFFTIRNTPIWTKTERLKEYIKSVCVGIFFALPTCTYLCERHVFTTDLSIMIAGGVSFAITDVIIKAWPKLIEGIGNIIPSILNRVFGKSD